MKASLNCIFLGMTAFSDSFTVSLYEKNNTENGEVVFDDLKIGHIKFLICREKDIKINNYNDLNLWKADFAYGYKLKILTEEQICNDSELLVPIIHFKEYFPDQDAINKSLIFVQVPVTELERKRKNTEVETTSRKRREWAVNSTIRNEISGSVYFVDPAETSRPLFNMIKKGEFVALYGARASGKSTRVDQALIELESEGYVCIYVSVEGVNMSTVNTFWSSIGAKLVINAPKYFKLNEVKSADEFTLQFRKELWNDKHVVLFIDEYDSLLEANDDIRSSFLGAIRNIKNSKRDYAIWSSVAIGPLSILFLKSDKINVSPFNVKEPFRNPNFTLAQVESIYKDYEDDNKLTIAPEVIKDIYERTNGHAGLVCLCGRAIQNNLEEKLDERRCLDFTLWSSFVASPQLVDRMANYSTFRKMVDNLIKPDAKKAMDFLRSVFIGFFDFVQINDNEERRLADYLTAQGVLMKENENNRSYRMSSIFVDGLIRQEVIPVLYKSLPTISVPRTKDNFLKTLDILREAIRCFDKNIISNAYNRSFKTALVPVDSCRNVAVPRESVYDNELNRILTNWIAKECDFQVTGQWHLIDHAGNDQKDKHYYSDIVIVTPKQTVVLELLATPTKNELEEHSKRVLNYAEKLSANEIWIVNFTCEDDALKKPYWPSNSNINIVHFSHDKTFNNIRMSARSLSTSDTVDFIEDQQVMP
ncbi:hypothetical protein RhiirA5_462251 [Rhizophagus irregularis]|uniref:Uncharacterized protein n=1 Tax=Rhizophagus irregularis TaxID=588596 RepID=A0A2N0NXH3_9GLOM|nr:hypothetical protein RhiirA5_462251 [Rhizophagus irregularis]